MVASPPDKLAIMPLRSVRLRANQLATEPESALRMQRSGSRELSSQNIRCGLIGSASTCARSSHELAPGRIPKVELILKAVGWLLLQERKERP